MRKHLDTTSVPDLVGIRKIGAQIRSAGFPLVELAKLHERLVVLDLLSASSAGNRGEIIRKAGNFFAEVIGSEESGNGCMRDDNLLKSTIESLCGRTVELATANRQLGMDVAQGKQVEKTLRKSEQNGLKALEKSESIKEEMRRMFRDTLLVQEEERKKISRELHEVIAQVLLGVNVRLASLKTEAGISTREIKRTISRAQKMILQSAETVHQLAHNLHPAALEDLGLIPALHSYIKSFIARTGVRTHLSAFEGVERINHVNRTMLYRIAQEALGNVARHALASHAEVNIYKESGFVRMEVTDNGRPLKTQSALLARGAKNLGLRGMRERVEMVGGHFEIKSDPGKGTTMIARIPVTRTTGKKWRMDVVERQPAKEP